MNIFLCGFMGAGKSTLLETLSWGNRGCQLIDSDEELIKRHYGSPDKIFSQGERSFRRRERKLLLELLERPVLAHRVIALGGGMLEDGRNLGDILASGGILVHLEVPFDVCWQRICLEGGTRPLVLRGREALERLYRWRLFRYKRAQLTLNDSVLQGIKNWGDFERLLPHLRKSQYAAL